MGEQDQQPDEEMDGLSYTEQSLLTLEKLSEFRSLFDYYKKNNRAKISEMKEDIFENFKGFVITMPEFDEFFKDYENDQAITEDQFFEIFNYYEQKVLQKASVFDNNEEDTQSEVDVQIESSQPEEETKDSGAMMDNIIGEAGSDNEDESDPEIALQEIIDCVIDMEDFNSMTTQQMGALIVKLKDKADKVVEKVAKIEKKKTKYHNKIDVLQGEVEYFKTKNGKLKTDNEELKDKTYKLEGDVEDLMKFEQDFQRMVKQCEDKDMEILQLEDDLEDKKKELYELEREFRR